MTIEAKYQNDIENLIKRIHDNGGDYWASEDGRLFVGNPFSTITCSLILYELGVDMSNPSLKGAVDLIIGAWRKDGRFKLAPTGTLQPCYTILPARLLCRLGYASDMRMAKTFEHLLETQYTDGGWRCNKFSFGRGPETEYSNPWPTLEALDAFRYTQYLNSDERLDKAVEFLLSHWEIRKPIGPCHYGMGSLFMRTEFPFLRYNIFYYLYVLSFYTKAKNDPRFLSALRFLQSKLINDEIIVENTNPKLKRYSFCEIGKPSILATNRYIELIENLYNVN
ncbi:MAG: prenyltransferase/squalene oxidase repeat-containing protein [Ruminiclostridium sp.]